MARTRTYDRTPTDDRRPRDRTGSSRPWHAVVAIALGVVLAAVLSSCGQEGQSGAAPLDERAENDVPLNPPTLRFHVSAQGQVDASPDLEAEAGEVVAVVLENESDSAYELRLLDPEGGDVFVVEAPADGRGDGRAMPRDVGPHAVEVYPIEDPGAAEEFVVDVSET